MNTEKIKEALQQHPAWRNALVQSLVAFEKQAGHPAQPVRDQVSGPLADALFVGETFTKQLQNGLTIRFVYNSKIAREFLLSDPEVPNHVWEPQTTKLLLHFARGALNILIAGAYFGDQAIPLAQAVSGSGGRVHNFEPNAQNAGLIQENAQLNQLSNVIVNNLALWNKSGERLVFEGEDALASTVEAGASASDALITITLDDYVQQQQLESVQLLMIDVEGSERKVLEGARQILQRDRPVVVFETHSLYDDWSQGLGNAPSVKMMRELGYEVYSVREFHQNIDTTGMPVELMLPEKTYCVTPPHHGFNMLAVPDPALISDPLFRVVEDLSPKLILTKNDPLFSPSKF